MTIRLPSAREQQVVEDAFRESLRYRESLGPFVDYSFDVDGEEYGNLINDGDWGSGDVGSIYADFSIAAQLDEIDDVPTSFAVRLGSLGVAVPQMAGISSLPNVGGTGAGFADAGVTEFLAVSARAVTNRISLGQITEFPGMRPDEVIRNVMGLAPYSREASTIAPTAEPILYFQRPDSHFWPNETVGDVFGRVEEQTTLKLRDNAFGGLVSYEQYQETTAKDFRYYNAQDFPVRWRPPPRAEARYSEVVVYYRTSSGEDAYEPQRASIDYRGQNPPLGGATLWMEYQDATELGALRARNLAIRTAQKLGRGPLKDDSVMLPVFDVLLEVGDVFYVNNRFEDSRSRIFDQQYICWVDSFKHHKQAAQTEASYTASLAANERVRVPDFAMPGLLGGVFKTELAACDVIGDLLRLEVDGLDWVEDRGEVLAVGVDAPTVTITGDLVSIECGATYTPPFFGEVYPDLIRFDSVAWATEASPGDLVVIDDAASGGHAVVSGDLVAIS